MACCVGVRVGARAQESGDARVRLLSTRVVSALTLVPRSNATVKMCGACAAVPMRSAVQVEVRGGGLEWNGAAAKVVEVAGDLRVEEKGSAVAAAAGRWRFDTAHGEMRVVVTIPRERYVMAVLASEAAADDAPAALQALAVVVRSFAMASTKKHAVEGFDFCDSTHCQAMRLAAVPARIEDAVRATAGETLWLHGARVPAYFTQHCAGVSEAASALWGGAARPWLVSHADAYCQRAPSQWHAEIAADDLREALRREGWVLHGVPDKLRVVALTPSGRVAKVEVAAGSERVMIPAAGFRFAVGRALGWNRLRSDWYTVNFSGGRAVFEGRGYGHGVGLCQAGAHAMAAESHGEAAQVERDILRFYFPGTAVRVRAEDEGWKRREGAGWTLLAVSAEDSVVRAGDAAWARAQVLFPVRGKVRPVVRVYPETELYRQSTGEPGWTLGAARGMVISTQPPAVVARHEAMEPLLLHEFLHVLVESESHAAAPLWLREGLVESLSEPQRASAKRMRVSEIDAVLEHPRSWAEADAGHRAAGTMVAELVARYGMTTVRGWLRSGVPAAVLADVAAR